MAASPLLVPSLEPIYNTIILYYYIYIYIYLNADMTLPIYHCVYIY
jgi:hypothetical protein